MPLSTSSTTDSVGLLGSKGSSTDMNDDYALTNLEEPLRPDHSGNESDAAFVSAEKPFRDQPNYSTPERETADTPKSLYARTIVELNHESTAQGRSSDFDHRHKVLVFVRRNPSVLAALTFGVATSLGSFAYLFWLSHQMIYCPSWAVDCHAKHSLGLIQGVLSSIYGISIASIAYAAYQFAETTLWPMLTEQPLSLEAIDRYVAHVRGSPASFPFAAWYMRRSKHVVIVLVIGLIGILSQTAATLIGWAFSIVPVSTRLHSNHTTGGGAAFGFVQINPPGPIPYELSNAVTMYSDWSNAQMPEALPSLREYLIDRTNLSSIGNFTIHALRARKAVRCYGQDIHVASQASDLTSGVFRVKTSAKFGGGYMGKTSEVLLRFEPNQLTLWADDYRMIRDSRVVTKLVFAIVNGTIENGKHNQHQQMMDNTCMGAYGYPCSGISAIACDVDVDVTEERVCNGRCEGATAKGKALTSLQTTSIGEIPGGLALYLGAIPTVIGPSVYGAQPVWSQGNYEQNSSYTLPIPFLGFFAEPPMTKETQHWSIGNLTNFINVTAGALGSQFAKAYPQGWTIVESTLEVPRLSPRRSFLLLAPPAVILLCVVILALLSSIIHKRTGVDSMRLGWTSEFLVHCANDEMRSLVNSVKAGDVEAELLHKKSLRFGQLADGEPGLSSSVEPFVLKRRPT